MSQSFPPPGATDPNETPHQRIQRRAAEQLAAAPPLTFSRRLWLYLLPALLLHLGLFVALGMVRPVLASLGSGPLGLGVGFLVSLPLTLVPVGGVAWMLVELDFAQVQVDHAVTPLAVAAVFLSLPGCPGMMLNGMELGRPAEAMTLEEAAASSARAPVKWGGLRLAAAEVRHICDGWDRGRGQGTAWTCWDVAPLRGADGKVAAWACSGGRLDAVDASTVGWLQPRPSESLMKALELRQATDAGPEAWKGRCVELSPTGPSGAWSTWALLALLSVLEIGLVVVALTAPGRPKTDGAPAGEP
jgi:hypothetical protein